MKRFTIDTVEIHVDEEKKKAALILWSGDRKFTLKQHSSELAEDYFIPLAVEELYDDPLTSKK
jgi:hypothetical protein